MRHGGDAWLPNDRESGKCGHTLMPVYGEMLLQICSDYRCLPDLNTMTMSQIRFFYEPLRPALRRATAPRTKKK